MSSKERQKAFPDATGRPTLQDVGRLISGGQAKKIVIMTGAGISTAAGIPDFRSPDTGLYANLEKYSLPQPEAIFDINYFVRRPAAFFTLAKELWPNNFKPTLAHYFFVLLHQKGLLLRCFSQNIDTLERLAGLPDDKLVEAHGSFANAHCLACKHSTTADELRPRIDGGEVVRCDRPSCKGKANALVKPDIVFFGEGLPKLFFSRLSDFSDADLLLVLGTSLQVQPFASLTERVSDSCPRVLINLEAVGEMDDFSVGGMFGRYREEGFDFAGRSRGGEEYARDIFFQGTADDGVTELAEALGWKDELLALFKAGHEHLEATTTPISTPRKKEPVKNDDDEALEHPSKADAKQEADQAAAAVVAAVKESGGSKEEVAVTRDGTQKAAEQSDDVEELAKGVSKVQLSSEDAKDKKAAL